MDYSTCRSPILGPKWNRGVCRIPTASPFRTLVPATIRVSMELWCVLQSGSGPKMVLRCTLLCKRCKWCCNDSNMWHGVISDGHVIARFWVTVTFVHDNLCNMQHICSYLSKAWSLPSLRSFGDTGCKYSCVSPSITIGVLHVHNHRSLWFGSCTTSLSPTYLVSQRNKPMVLPSRAYPSSQS